MAYTNTWDVTAPLDTQAANQGAVDFRATKLDVMQRIASFGAGLLAARPTPEATGATADWTGVMYWATDTNQTFRWNGTTWVDISGKLPGGGGVLFSNGAPVVMANNNAEQTIYTSTVPANTLGTSGGLECGFWVNPSVLTGTLTVILRFGGQFVTLLLDTTHVTQPFFVFVRMQNTAANAQIFSGYSLGNAVAVSVFAGSTLAIDTTAAQTFLIAATKSVGADTVTFTNGYAKLI